MVRSQMRKSIAGSVQRPKTGEHTVHSRNSKAATALAKKFIRQVISLPEQPWKIGTIIPIFKTRNLGLEK